MEGWIEGECREERKLLQSSVQEKYKVWYDAHKSVKFVDFKVGQWVRIRLPEVKVRKGEMRYSYPQKIVEVSGSNSAVRLVNGQWWNISRVVKVKPPGTFLS